MGMVPVGAMMMWPTSTAPAGWAMCNGAQVDAATYPQLATLLGQSGGKVTLPNLGGRVPLGVGSGHTLGQTGGAETVALSTAQMPAHAHGINDPGHAHAMNGESAGGATLVGHGGNYLVGSAGGVGVGGNMIQVGGDAGFWSAIGVLGAATNVSVQNNGSSAAHENLPPFVVVNYIIRMG
jgi:microcystin-dependent protein